MVVLDLLEKGADADKLAEKMSPMDIFLNYDTLISHGAENIDITKIALEIPDGYFVWTHLEEFAKYGADVDRLADELFSVLFIDDAEKLLKNGASIIQVFNMSDEMLLLNTNNPEGLLEIFTLFHQYGMPEEYIRAWFTTYADYKVLEDIVNNGAKWKHLGAFPGDFLNKYLAWREYFRNSPS